MLDKPLAYLECSVWANNSRYYINGKSITLTSKMYDKHSPDFLASKLKEYQERNSYEFFNKYIEKFNVKKFMKDNPDLTHPDFYMVIFNETDKLVQ